MKTDYLETGIYWAVMSGSELVENTLSWSKTLKKYIRSNELADQKVVVFMELPKCLIQDDMFYWTKVCPDCKGQTRSNQVAEFCQCGYVLCSG
jgi:hypothetical protein